MSLYLGKLQIKEDKKRIRTMLTKVKGMKSKVILKMSPKIMSEEELEEAKWLVVDMDPDVRHFPTIMKLD